MDRLLSGRKVQYYGTLILQNEDSLHSASADDHDDPAKESPDSPQSPRALSSTSSSQSLDLAPSPHHPPMSKSPRSSEVRVRHPADKAVVVNRNALQMINVNTNACVSLGMVTGSSELNLNRIGYISGWQRKHFTFR